MSELKTKLPKSPIEQKEIQLLLDFKESLQDKTLEEMQTMRDQLETEISKMVLESEVVSKLIILEAVMSDRLDKERETGNGKA